MTYEAVIRVNSFVLLSHSSLPSLLSNSKLTFLSLHRQSGKGGVAYLVQRSMQLDLPKKMQPAFYQVVQSISERTAKEITSDDIEKAFRATYYLDQGVPKFELVDYEFATKEGGKKQFRGVIRDEGKEVKIEGEGNGPVSALLQALNRAWPEGKHNLEVKEYSEHALGHGSDGALPSSSFLLLLLFLSRSADLLPSFSPSLSPHSPSASQSRPPHTSLSSTPSRAVSPGASASRRTSPRRPSRPSCRLRATLPSLPRGGSSRLRTMLLVRAFERG